MSSYCKASIMGLFLTLFIMAGIPASAKSFHEDFEQTYGDQRLQLLDGGQHFTLAQDQGSGAGFKTKNEYLFGRFDMDMKLAPGNSAGTVTTFYLSSPQGHEHDEIDIEFLGNSTGNPYTLHTNVYSKGKGNKEQQFHLWFDPTAEFHNYTIIWNPTRIIWLVDNSPIRIFQNFESALGVPYPHSKPMRVYCSFWNADDWATQGGKVKADWSTGTKTVSYKNHNISACLAGQQDCANSNAGDGKSWQNYDLGDAGHDRLRWVQEKFRVSNYCADKGRFPEGIPRECMHSEFQNPANPPTGANPANSPTGATPANPPIGANPANPPAGAKPANPPTGANPANPKTVSKAAADPAKVPHDANPHPAQPQVPHDANPHPANPGIPHPVNPGIPHPANPGIPHPAQPQVPHHAQPHDPHPVNPTIPNPANPANPNPGNQNPANPANPNSANPVNPNPANSANPNPANPAIPNPANPAIPNPANPTDPNPANPVNPNPTNPAIPNPTNPAIPNPANPAIPNPANPAGPNPANPASPTNTYTPSEPINYKPQPKNPGGKY